MAEYVSKETLLKAVEKMDRLDKEGTPYEYDKEGYILLIENAPAADVEEVVRCKDCKYATEVTGCDNTLNFSWKRQNYVKLMDFCSCGERGDG